jgi:RNA polymerase sigma-70 factor (ECF subfamily)
MMTTPPSLLERLRRSPEQAAWERFVDLYTPLLFAWANRLGLTGHDAADLVQDLFAVLVEKLPQFEYDGRKSFRAWVKTILLNLWRNRQRRRAKERLVAGHPLEELAGDAESAAFEEAEYRRHLVRRILDLMQAEFQPVTWKACWEYVVEDRPAAEVAARLGITVNAVYLAKSRVLRRLREELEGLLD